MQLKAFKSIVLGLLALIAPRLDAQIQKLENVLTATISGTGPIISDGVNGYYALYALDKKTKGKSDFQLSVFDQNLSPLSSKKFVMATGAVSREAAFNGQHLSIPPKTKRVK